MHAFEAPPRGRKMMCTGLLSGIVRVTESGITPFHIEGAKIALQHNIGRGRCCVVTQYERAA